MMTQDERVARMRFIDGLYRTPSKRREFEAETTTPPLLVGDAGFNEDRDAGRLQTYHDRFWGWASARHVASTR